MNMFNRSTGFVLEGFPRTVDEAQWMADSGLYPDTAVLLAVEDSDVIGRLLPPKMEKWKARRDRKLARKQKIKDKKQKKKELAMAKRRAVLVKERDERLAEKKVCGTKTG